ncbi:hypothetical protein D3C76_1404300 [compost metagenome]
MDLDISPDNKTTSMQAITTMAITTVVLVERSSSTSFSGIMPRIAQPETSEVSLTTK